MPSEFALIRRHFTRPARHTDLAVGDDAALIRPAPGMQLAISTDMLVAGTHFFADTDPADLGWKTLAVNVSDLAAMGAIPRWVVLAASLPAADENWIAAFASGFFAYAAYHMVERAVVTPSGEIRLETTGSAWSPPTPALIKIFILVVMILLVVQFLVLAVNYAKRSAKD